MGMFDSVIKICDKCENGEIEFQSKAGECLLRTYNIQEVPIEIAISIDGDVSSCNNCNEIFTITISDIRKIVSMDVE